MYDNLYLHGFEDSEAVGAAAAVAWGSGAEALRNGRARALRRGVCGAGGLWARGFLDTPGFLGVRWGGWAPQGPLVALSVLRDAQSEGLGAGRAPRRPFKEQKGSPEPQNSAGLPQSPNPEAEAHSR